MQYRYRCSCAVKQYPEGPNLVFSVQAFSDGHGARPGLPGMELTQPDDYRSRDEIVGKFLEVLESAGRTH